MVDDLGPQEIVDDAGEYIDLHGFTNFVRNYGIGGIFLALVYTAINFITSAGGVVMKPLVALGDGLSKLVEETIGGPVGFIGDAWETASTSIVEGTASLLGITAPIAAMIVAGTFMFVAFWFYTRIEFSPLAFIRNRPLLNR